MRRLLFTLTTALCAGGAAPAQSAAPDDLLARAAGQELSVARMAALLGGSRVPATPTSVGTTVDLWVSYHLLAQAGARGDDLANDDGLAREAMWYEILKLRNERWYDSVRRTFPVPDDARIAAEYARGRMLAAQHILLTVPGGASAPARVRDSVRAAAEALARRATSANFSALARQFSQDPGSRDMGGSLGIFPLANGSGAMLPEFEAAVRALAPGQIATQVLRTAYGYHVIRRHLLAEVREGFVDQLRALTEGANRDAYLARVRRDNSVQFVPGAPARIRAIAKSATPAEFERDTTTLVTSRAGSFTSMRLVQWLEAVASERPLATMLADAPDSTVTQLVGSLVMQELLNAEAERARVVLDTTDLRTVLGGFTTMVRIASLRLRVDPEALRETGATADARARAAAARVEAVMDQIYATGGDGYAEIPAQLAAALRSRYPSRVNAAQFAAAAGRAVRVRAALDSTAAPVRR